MPALLIALAVVAGIQPGFALAQEDGLDDLFTEPCSEADDADRFQLCNSCRPMELVVEGLNNDAKKIGLTEERLKVAAESRLRAARLYTDSWSAASGAFLYINVNAFRNSFSLLVQYNKRLIDPVSGETSASGTWSSGTVGGHGGDPGYIGQSLSERLDKFLVEYLRVNEKDCPR